MQLFSPIDHLNTLILELFDVATKATSGVPAEYCIIDSNDKEEQRIKYYKETIINNHE